MRPLILFAILLGGCRSFERAAARDPMKCERDPACANKRGKMRDCATQCADDPACIERCKQGETDTLGR
jgi:hypothetical protein